MLTWNVCFCHINLFGAVVLLWKQALPQVGDPQGFCRGQLNLFSWFLRRAFLDYEWESTPAWLKWRRIRIWETFSRGMVGWSRRWIVGALLWSIVVKKELHQKAKLLIYWYVCVPSLIYDHEVWIMTKIMKSWVRGAETSFLHILAELSFRDQVEQLLYLGGAQCTAGDSLGVWSSLKEWSGHIQNL